MKYPTHPAADLFPLLSDPELSELADDIRLNGLREPIWLYEDPELGQVLLDGRNRSRACAIAGVAPTFRTYEGNDPVGFVISYNLKRRHLSESQRAMVADQLAQLPRGKPNTAIAVFTQEQAADLLNVSADSVQRARVVREQGVPELSQAVSSGQVPVSTAADIARAPKDEQRDILANADPKEITKAAAEIKRRRREERIAEKAKKVTEISQRTPAPLVHLGPFPVLYVDPPWRYDFAEDTTRQIENNYPTMTLDEIKGLAIPAADNSVLFLWVTSPKLTEGLDVMSAWGFDYRTCMVWVKDKIGMGYYARQQHELLLIGRRGSLPVPDPEDRPPSVVHAVRNEHSTKPERMYELIERMYPLLERCELFQRRPRDGWAGWGNEA
jgi:N6-adenosine-specific RNA methylase IME4